MIGYAAALEQFHPTELLSYSILAERHGFGGVMAADHFQPWVPQQGHNAFVWAWMAALGQATSTLTFHDAWALLARARQRRGAERARRRRGLA
jgi:alkanesulfonate monooxygenase SsuD/methylene tetrahydromethanopterin reductase-like flavin-dependent oxidoreductase (luciferase family)